MWEVKLSQKLIKKNRDEVYDDIRMFNIFDESLNIYGLTVSAEWDYTQDRPYKCDTIEEKCRIYLHYFYSIKRSTNGEQFFDKCIMDYCNEHLSSKPVEDHKEAYTHFFKVKNTPVRGITGLCKKLKSKLLANV